MKKSLLCTWLCAAALLSGCNNEDEKLLLPDTQTTTPGNGSFYLLNEGNYGQNNATLDFFDAEDGTYYTNIYPSRNPEVAMELGGTGTDLKIYENRLYAVMNGSHKVEIMTADSAKHIADVDVPNCRYICFEGGYAYVSSYTAQVYKIDIAAAKVVDSVSVGREPEEMAVVGGKLYVANSGGYSYLSGEYDSTVSVIDLATFREIKKIDVAINLHHLKADGKGNLYVTSRGNYGDIPSNLYVIDLATETVKALNIAASDIGMDNNIAYVYSSEWSDVTGKTTYTSHTIDLNSQTVSEGHFIPEGVAPYSLTVNPITKELVVTDAGDYTTSGKVYFITPDGKIEKTVFAGVSPGHVAFK